MRQCNAVLVAGSVVGVFRENRLRKACAYAEGFDYPQVVKMGLADALRRLRSVVYRDHKGRCGKCGKTVTWETAEMNERKPRGTGGDYTRDNCEILCGNCHTGTFAEHGFGKGRKVS